MRKVIYKFICDNCDTLEEIDEDSVECVPQLGWVLLGEGWINLAGEKQLHLCPTCVSDVVKRAKLLVAGKKKK